MSGIEVLIAGIGFCSSVVPTLISVGIKKFKSRKKISQKMINLYTHDYFKYTNTNILQSKYLYSGNNIYESIYLSIKYEQINILIHNFILEMVNNNKCDEEEFIERIRDILCYKINYLTFNDILKKTDFYDLHSDFFINIKNFNMISKKIDLLENKHIYRILKDFIDKKVIITQKEKYLFFDNFLYIFKILLSNMFEHVIKNKMGKKKYDINNVLLEIDSNFRIINYNSEYIHIIEYLNNKILYKNILEINIISNPLKFKSDIKKKRKVLMKMKTGLLDDTYSIDIKVVYIDEKIFICLKNIFCNSMTKKYTETLSPITTPHSNSP